MVMWHDGFDNEVLHGRGIVYCAYNKKYIDIAAVSATSAKKYTDVPCVIFTANVPYAKTISVFDHVFGLIPETFLLKYFVDRERLPSIKLLSLLKSPFSKTLYLDSDTLIKGSLHEVFELLEYNDIALTRDCETTLTNGEKNGRKKHGSLLNLTHPVLFNSGVFGYSRSEAAMQFVKSWIRDFILMSDKDPDSGNWGHVNDQSSLNRIIKRGALKNAEIKPVELPNTIFNATGRMLVELDRQGKLGATKIIHTIIAHNWVKKGGDVNNICDDPFFEHHK